MKRVLGIGGGLLVVVAIAVFFLYSSLGAVITSAVEKFGSEITQTKITLKEADISATDGKGTLRGFKMTNPANFKTESAVEFDEISMTLDIKTITEDIIVVKDITIAGPMITYEHSSGGSNIDVIKNNVDSYLGTQANSSKKSSGDDSSNGKKLIIEKLSIVNGKANVSAAILQGKTMSVSLPNIVLKDIGKSKGGATPGEVASKVMDSIQSNINGAVKHLSLDQAKEAVGAVVSGAKDMLEKSTSGAKDMLGKGTSGTQDLLENSKDLIENNPVGDAVKGLFGN
jgi:hypothetical protein